MPLIILPRFRLLHKIICSVPYVWYAYSQVITRGLRSILKRYIGAMLRSARFRLTFTYLPSSTRDTEFLNFLDICSVLMQALSYYGLTLFRIVVTSLVLKTFYVHCTSTRVYNMPQEKYIYAST